MKYLTLLFCLCLTACSTSPKFLSLTDKNGDRVGDPSPPPFFSAPDGASDWTFWYVLIGAGLFFMIWNEVRKIWFTKPRKTVSPMDGPTPPPQP